MNRPTELIEINVREKNPLKQRRSLIYLFTIAQLLYGFNFGFFNPKSKIKIYATKLMMIFMAFVMLIMLIVRFESVGLGRRWIIIYIVQYLPTFITLFFSTHSLCEFLTDMIIILDKQSKDSTFNTVGPIACLYLTVTFVIKTAAACFFFWSVLPILTEIPWMGLDVISVANFVLFYLVFVCMKNLKEELGGQEISAERFNMTYEAIADSFEKFRKSYDGIFIWSFLAGCFKWMAMIWDHLFYIHSSYVGIIICLENKSSTTKSNTFK